MIEKRIRHEAGLWVHEARAVIGGVLGWTRNFELPSISVELAKMTSVEWGDWRRRAVGFRRHRLRMVLASSGGEYRFTTKSHTFRVPLLFGLRFLGSDGAQRRVCARVYHPLVVTRRRLTLPAGRDGNDLFLLSEKFLLFMSEALRIEVATVRMLMTSGDTFERDGMVFIV